MPPPVGAAHASGPAASGTNALALAVRASLLGRFSISLGPREAGPWRRPPAKHLCELVLLSPGRRLTRERAVDALFPRRDPLAGGRALSQALSYARQALSALGEPGTALLQADRALIWANPAVELEVDLDMVYQLLRQARTARPGADRDKRLVLALANGSPLLEDEPFADWAMQAREDLDRARRDARLQLARDRASGLGQTCPAAVVDAWEACLASDPTCEEAASALVRLYGALGKNSLARGAYERCRAALDDRGLWPSPFLEEIDRTLSPTRSSRRYGAMDRLWPEEQRRLVTMLFVEVVPAQGDRTLGLEEFRELLSTSLADVMAHVEGLGGTVTSVSGAGLAAVFGVPESHEDDLERALRAAYRAVARAGGGPGDVVLRAGVECGEAVVGTADRAYNLSYGVVGEVVSVAAALQAAARPASVLVGPSARVAAEELFEWGPTEEVATSTEKKPLICFYLERPRPRPSGQVGRKGLARKARLVGRHDEMACFREVLQGVVAGKGGILVVTGEPGLGKTRLVAECRRLFMAWVGAASGRLPLWLEGRAASYASTTPFGLYQYVLGAWIGVAPDEPEEIVEKALDRALRAVFREKTSQDRAHLISQVIIASSNDDVETEGKLTPEQTQRAIFEAVREVVSRLVANGPTVVVLEDMHWADPTSLRLTHWLASVARDGPLLLLMTRRPEPDPGVSVLEESMAADVHLESRRIDLGPLDLETERELARVLLGEGAPEDVVNLLTQGTDGNPLFLEERLSSLLDTRALVPSTQGWRVDEYAENEVPEALERLILSRVDRMGRAARQVMVEASVLGPEFALSSLGWLTPVDEELRGTLGDLCAAGLVAEVGNLPGPVYRFRHALIRDAAYNGLLRDERHRLHAKVAWAMEEASGNRLEEVAPVLGHHFAAAGETGRASHYFELAGDRAASVFANEEAVSSYQRAMAVMDGGSPGAAAVKRQITLSAKLMEVLWHAGRLAEAQEVFQETIVADDGQDRFLTARLYYLFGQAQMWQRQFGSMLGAFRTADRLLGDNPESLDEATFDLWFDLQMEGLALCHYWRDETDDVAAVLERVRPVMEVRGGVLQRQAYNNALGLFQAVKLRHRADDEMVVHYRAALQEAEQCCGEYQVGWRVFGVGWSLFLHGDLAEAEDALHRSLAISERIGNPSLEAFSLSYLTLTALRRHDEPAIAPLAKRAIAASSAAVLPDYLGMAKAGLVWLAWRQGRTGEVERLAEEVLTIWSGSAWHPFHWACVFPLVDVRLAVGRTADAIEVSRQLLVPPQQRLPDELEASLQASIAAWDSGQPQVARRKLAASVKLAQRLGYA